MNLVFKNETFRDDFTFSNSPAAIKRFPFPFHEDKYMYSVNIEPHGSGPKGSPFEFPIDIDEHYVSEMADRAKVLEQDPKRWTPVYFAAEFAATYRLFNALNRLFLTRAR